MRLDEMVRYLDGYLRVREVPDDAEAMNGLQVENTGAVKRIAVAVDACEAVIQTAARQGADLLLVHHGLFWAAAHPWTGSRYQLLRCLLEHDLAVYSSHLPLDAHPHERIIRTCLNLKVTNKHKYNFKKTMKNLRSFSRILRRVGFNKTTRKPFWKMFFTVLIKNPKADEWAVSLSAIFLHFYKHSNFVVDLTNQQIDYIDKYGEDVYNQSRIKMTETKIVNYAN